jgi:hypothetical protein
MRAILKKGISRLKDWVPGHRRATRVEVLRLEELALARWSFQGGWVLIMVGVMLQGSVDLLATWHAAHVSHYVNKLASFFPYLCICCSNSWIFAAFWMFLGFGLVTRGATVFGASSRLNQSDISDLLAKSLSNSSWITRAAKDKLA